MTRAPPSPISLTREDGTIKPMADIEREAISAVLAATGSMSSTARELGIGRSTLYRKIAEMNINNKGNDHGE